jgi:hypothetical protein
MESSGYRLCAAWRRHDNQSKHPSRCCYCPGCVVCGMWCPSHLHADAWRRSALLGPEYRWPGKGFLQNATLFAYFAYPFITFTLYSFCMFWLGLALQLGDGTYISRPTPPTSDVLTGVSAISLGSHFTCALMAGATAGVRCWGSNNNGQERAGFARLVCVRISGTRIVVMFSWFLLCAVGRWNNNEAEYATHCRCNH